MSLLVWQAYWTLLRFHLYLARGDFAGLHARVRGCVRREQQAGPDAVREICAAVDVACIWYWKEVLCLQRSAATAYLLKRHGVPAQMVIGAQQIPFKAHAWVEVGGVVVNDKPYVGEIYSALDRL